MNLKLGMWNERLVLDSVLNKNVLPILLGNSF